MIQEDFVKKNNVVINNNRDSYQEYKLQKERALRLKNIEESISMMQRDIDELKKIISEKN